MALAEAPQSNPEASRTRVEFSPEQIEALTGLGYKISTIGDASVNSIRESGDEFASNWHEGLPFENDQTPRTQIAFKPEELMLAGTNNMTLSEQKQALKEYDERLGAVVPGVSVELRSLPMLLEVFSQLQRETGKRTIDEFGNRDSRAVTKARRVISRHVDREGNSHENSEEFFVTLGGTERGHAVGYFVPDEYRSSKIFASAIVTPK